MIASARTDIGATSNSESEDIVSTKKSHIRVLV
jgi:hypothetical protein